MSGTPRVFISYSHDSDAHKRRVLELADRLRTAGLDVAIDRYVSFPAEGWPLWCERQIERADRVILVCTAVYHRRVRNEEASGTGLGVLHEAHVIRQELYDGGGVSSKFVPVLFSDGSPADVPRPVRRFSRYVVDSDDGFEGLYRLLTGQPAAPPPAIGERIVLASEPRPGLSGWPGVTQAEARLAPFPLIRIFISSPADVEEERDIARRLIESELLKRPALRGKVQLVPVAWDDAAARIPMLVTQSPQDSVNDVLPRPADCDIVVVIFGRRWARRCPIPPASRTAHRFRRRVGMLGCGRLGAPAEAGGARLSADREAETRYRRSRVR
jgi:hypothetical protein